MEFTDEPALAKNPIIKRRIMEFQGGEVRRIHIIYYLSRKGRIEHPHLIRVHHLSRNGVHLRDVKRWLLELRGKEMANSFAWSFKRRYKKGFLWQDLVDEDLITPISDNEYVLKGSEISSATFISDISPFGEEKEVIIQKEPLLIDQINNKNPSKENSQVLMDDLAQKMSEIDESSPQYSTQTSTVTEDSIKLEEEHDDSDSPKEKKQVQKEEDEKGKFENEQVYEKNSNENIGDTSASFRKSTFTRSKSRNGASSRFRSFISCKRVDTIDSATVKVNKFSKISTDLSNNTREICDLKKGMCQINREHINRGSGRKSWSRVKGPKKDGFDERRTISAAYRPIHGPNCSQCGREFKPEKLHKHMKSCRGMKSFAKFDKKSNITISVDSPDQDSDSAYHYLTHN